MATSRVRAARFRSTFATLALLIVLLWPSPLAAQAAGSPSPPSTAADAKTLTSPTFAKSIRGKQIVVTTSDGSKRKGKFTVGPTGLVVADTQPAEVVRFDDIVTVKMVSHALRNGTLIGLGIGLGIGLAAAIGAGTDTDEPEVVVFFPAALGAGIGAGFGALIQRSNSRALYDAKRKTTSVAPILTQTRRGVAVSVSWR